MKVTNKLPLFFLKNFHIIFNFLIKLLYYICNKNQIKMKRSGKSVIMRNGIWVSDFKARNSKGKKTAWVKAEAKNYAHSFRHDKSWKNDI